MQQRHVGGFHRHRCALAVGLAAVLATACARDRVAEPPPRPPDPASLAIPQDDLVLLAEEPDLREELRGTPHRFFRFVNAAFAQCVCDRLTALDIHAPPVNLHGDAHVEQYAVSTEERGLADFDAATIGPPAIDLVRFAVSLRIIATQQGWSEDRNRLVDAFLDGYVRGLDEPTAEVHEPRAAARLRSRFAASTREWLATVDDMMVPLPESKFARLLDAKLQYRERMLAQNPGLAPDFFTPKRAGSLVVGVGSAKENKYLVRVEGPSKAVADDVILEMKQMSDLRHIRCLASAGFDPVRVIIGQSRIGAAPSDLLGYLKLDGEYFYVQKWRVNYTELRAKDLRSADELTEVAYETGQQLGRGHPLLIGSQHDVQLRAALLEHVLAMRIVVAQWAIELEDEVHDAWETFRAPRTRRAG